MIQEWPCTCLPAPFDETCEGCQRNAEGWHSIADAPTDGTRIRVGRYMAPFGWITGTATYERVNGIGGCWISRGDGVFGELGLAHPTHWQSVED